LAKIDLDYAAGYNAKKNLFAEIATSPKLIKDPPPANIEGGANKSSQH
jgi:hypothetical protein